MSWGGPRKIYPGATNRPARGGGLNKKGAEKGEMEIRSRECGGIERKLGDQEGRPHGDGYTPR